MNKKQQQLFISFFEQLHETQQILDKLKIDLTLCEGFNPNLLFNLISESGDRITIKQMRFFLTDRMTCSQRQLYEVFEKFDWSRNGYITREDFIRELTPFGRQVLEFKHNNGIVNSRIQGAFIALFIEILKRFRIIDVSRKQIVFIQPYDAFAHLDIFKKGIIGIEQLQRFYKQNDFEIGQIELFYLLHALRRRCYRDVNLQVFSQNLNPLQFGEYLNFTLQIEHQHQKQYLKRSRHQQQLIKRSRVQAQKLEHQTQRLQRRLNLQDKINLEILDHERNQQRNIRRGLRQQQWRINEESRKMAELQMIKERERLAQEEIARSALRNEAELQASRRSALYQKQRALQQQIGRELDTYRTVSRIRELQSSRRQSELQAIRERERALRQFELSRYRKNSALQSSLGNQYTNKQSRMIELEKQLQKTRVEIRERRNRLDLEEQMRRQY